MGSDDRFYLLEMRNRPVLYGDIGSLIKIEGLVIGGATASAILLLPSHSFRHNDPLFDCKVQELNIEEWSDFIRRSDDPEILIGPNYGSTTMTKIFQRKARWEISGAVQQKVWAADGFKCYYCGAAMGAALLTVDHFTPLELGGRNDVTNYLTSCKKCNKDKGSEPPQDFCARRKLDFKATMEYLASRRIA